MKKLTFLILCGLVAAFGAGSIWAAPPSPPGPPSNAPKDEKAVTATMEAMAKATVDKDVATLNKIYGDDLTYSHSSALTQTKAEVLKAFDGPGISEYMKFSGTTIRIYGDVALFKGICDLRNGRPGAMADNHLNILWVLVRRAQGPYGWQIVARQTTRIPEPAATSRAGAPAPATRP
jgi:ketosteroid isomerase-like protein